MSKRYQGVYEDKVRRTFRYQFESQGRIFGQRGFATQRDAARAMVQRRAEVLDGFGVEGRGLSFGRFVESDFLTARQAKVGRGEIRSSTLRQNERDLRCHLLPALANRPLREIEVRDVERLTDRLSQEGLSNHTVKRVILTLGLVLKLARKYRYIAYNPVSDADKPLVTPSHAPVPSVDQIYRLAAVMPTLEARTLVLFAAFTGARKSECFGLRWQNVDLTVGTERVWITEQYYKGENVDRTKTRAGMREEVLAPQAADALRELSVAQQLARRPNPLALVFPAPRGGYWRDSNFDRRVWQKAREAAGLADLKFHTLRAFWKSHAHELPEALAQQLLGHSDLRTHRSYSRPIPGTEMLIREALGRAFVQTTERPE